MNKNCKSRYPITDLAQATAERVRLGGDILIALAHAVAANERTQRRFRYAVINKLSRIEALLGLVHVSQLARDQSPKPYYKEKLFEDSRAAEEYVAQQSHEAGLAMVRYIYGEAEEAGADRKKRPKWSDCPLYEI